MGIVIFSFILSIFFIIISIILLIHIRSIVIQTYKSKFVPVLQLLVFIIFGWMMLAFASRLIEYLMFISVIIAFNLSIYGTGITSSGLLYQHSSLLSFKVDYSNTKDWTILEKKKTFRIGLTIGDRSNVVYLVFPISKKNQVIEEIEKHQVIVNEVD